MRISPVSGLFFVSYIAIFFSINVVLVSGQCQSDQKQLLLEFKSSFNSTSSGKLMNWNQTTDCCSWDGVSCEGDGRVVGLDLSNQFILGAIDSSSSLFRLQHLQRLNLFNNKLLQGSFQNFPLNSSLQTLVLSDTNFGGQLPDSIGNLAQLTRIELARCNFSGPIPESIQKLQQLAYLDFSLNNFSGPMPSFSSSRNLIQLNLAFNQLNGTIHSTEWSGLSKLICVDLRNNELSGTIPSTLFGIPLLQKILLSQNQFNGSLEELHGKKASLLIDTLDLSSNKLQGQFPKSVFGFQGLKILTLSSNNFSGSIEWTDIQRLRNLSSLDLSYNVLSVDASATNSTLSFPNITTLKLASCNLTEFPGFLKTQPKLNQLDLSNNQISGEIPNWIWGFERLAYLNLSHNFLMKFEGTLQNITSSLVVVDLHGNQLQGKLPSLPPYATYLDYSDNNFSSVLPPEIGDFLQLAVFFSLSGNNFHGNIPQSICNGSYLQVLDLSNNSLSGPIPPCLTKMSVSLGVLNLRRNNISGIISDTFPENCGLQTLDLNRNRLEGQFPESLANCKMLEVLDIGNNQISGTFPRHLKNITKLRVLVLRSNKFSGSIHCPKNNSFWPMLQIVDVASNNFRGTLHQECLSSWVAMKDVENEAQSKLKYLQFKVLQLNPFYYQDAITVTTKGLELELEKVLTVFTSIDVSCNNFEGPIPEVIGEFTALHILNFSHNAFAGPIPSFLGNLRQLESLDLSNNYFNGVIPFPLANLNFLSFLNVSNNKLVGQIPTSTQLQSFSEASFENNSGLCGPPLSVQCESGPSPENNVGLCGHDLSLEAECESPAATKDKLSNSRSGSYMDWHFLIGAEIGFIFGLGIFIAPLMYWKGCRIWYYKQVDRLLLRLIPKLGHNNRNHGRVAHR